LGNELVKLHYSDHVFFHSLDFVYLAFALEYKKIISLVSHELAQLVDDVIKSPFGINSFFKFRLALEAIL
jgi:hypothetical protein